MIFRQNDKWLDFIVKLNLAWLWEDLTKKYWTKDISSLEDRLETWRLTRQTMEHFLDLNTWLKDLKTIRFKGFKIDIVYHLEFRIKGSRILGIFYVDIQDSILELRTSHSTFRIKGLGMH